MNAPHDMPGTALNLLLEITVLLDEDMNRDLAARGLTRARAHVIWLVADGPLTQRELADRLEVSPRNVTGLVDGLVETGFAERRPHPNDRRATHVVLSTKGAQAAATLRKDAAELAEQLFGDLADRRLRVLRRDLEHVRDTLRDLLV